MPGAVVARVNASPRFIPELIEALAGLVVEVRDARGHPEPARGARPPGRRLGRELTLSLVPSYAVLCAAQAATVAAPARQARARGRSWVWLAVPAALLGAGVLIINVVPQGPHWLARLATFGTPALAASYGFFRGSPRWWVWPPVAAGLWFAAWLASGLAQDAAGTALIAVACLAAASAIAMAAPAWSIRVGLVCARGARRRARLGNAERGESDATRSRASPAPSPPARPCRACSRRPSAPRSWAGSTCSPPRCSASSWSGGESSAPPWSTGIAAGLWGLLLFSTSEVAATVPVLAGLAYAAADARRSRLRHPLEPARAGGGARGDRRGGA